MKILILTHSYPDSESKWRGLFIQDQAKALSAKHEVFVVYFRVGLSHKGLRSKYSFIKRKNEAITEYELSVPRVFSIINQANYLYVTYRFIKKEILSRTKIDLIHSHLSYPAGLLGTIIQKRENLSNVLTEHSWITNYYRSPIHRLSVMYTLKNTKCIITVSNALKDRISAVCKREILVVPNVVDTGSFVISDRKRNGKLNIGLMGGMRNNIKGIDVLLKAVSLLKNMNLLVHIGGDGKLLEEYKELARSIGIAGQCIFYGEIERESKNDFYKNLDVYVMASRAETFGVVVVEAMSSGLPVIATRCGGPEEIITPETGILAEKENPESLAEAIRYMSENLESYNREAIRKYAIEKYGPEAFIKNITPIYEAAINHGTR